MPNDRTFNFNLLINGSLVQVKSALTETSVDVTARVRYNLFLDYVTELATDDIVVVTLSLPDGSASTNIAEYIVGTSHQLFIIRLS